MSIYHHCVDCNTPLIKKDNVTVSGEPMRCYNCYYKHLNQNNNAKD
jgi:hypothetical protein